MTHIPTIERSAKIPSAATEKSRRQFLKQSIYTLSFLGLHMTTFVANGQNHPALSQLQGSASLERVKNSPQYRDGKFRNAIENVYDEGAAWRAAIKELLFGKRVDPVPRILPPVHTLTGADFHTGDAAGLRFVRLGHSTILLQAH